MRYTMLMKLTKYGHACFTLEEQGQKVIVDPGGLTQLPEDLSGIVAIVVTHDHFDHLNEDNIQRIKAANPEAQLFGAHEAVAKLPGATEPAKGRSYVVGPFDLMFYGDFHEIVKPGAPQLHNFGVCINDKVAYPGDSFSQLGKRVTVMMTPANAPWAKVRETIAFVSNAQAEVIMPTHDGLLSEAGQQTYDAHLKEAAESGGSRFQRLAVGESVEI